MKYKLVVIFIALLFTACQEQIVHNLDEVQANNMKVALAKTGIPAKKIKEGDAWSISVSSSLAEASLRKLTSDRLLSRIDEVPEGPSSSFIQSPEERTYLLERKLARNLERTLERIPGVLEARVHINQHANNALEILGKEKGETASVLLISVGNHSLSEEEVKKIVEGASGVEAKKIAVIIAKQPVSQMLEVREDLSFPDVLIEEAQAAALPTSHFKRQIEFSYSVIFISLLVLILGMFFFWRKFSTKKKLTPVLRPQSPISKPEVF